MDDASPTPQVVADEAPERPPAALLLAEAGSALMLLPRRAPADIVHTTAAGDGHPVLVMPAFLAGDWQTAPLRHFLKHKGYRVYGWGLGTNWGPTRNVLEGMERRLDEIRTENGGRKVSLVGHSLGGVLARELAKLRPDAVRQVIVMTAPIRHPTATRVDGLYEFLSLFHSPRAPEMRRRLNEPPEVPVTALYTRTDGIVAWRTCLEFPGPRRESIEVAGAHGTMARNFAAWRIIADRLALPEAAWRPYRHW